MSPANLQHDDYTVGWVCALPIELAASHKMLDERHPSLPQDPHDDNIYTLGRIDQHNVVIAGLPAGITGTNSAAAVAVRMKSTFPALRFGLMVGIGGGVPHVGGADIRLGDVVVSQPHMRHGGVIQYDFGKSSPTGFEQTGFLNSSPMILLNALAVIQARSLAGERKFLETLAGFSDHPVFSRDNAGPDDLFEPSYVHLSGDSCRRCSKQRLVGRAAREKEPKVHFGTIASGNQVIKDGVLRDRLSQELGGVLCFEMEAAGLMNNFPCLVIRGICDYADSHKNKRWQGYAAAAAAAWAKEFLPVIPPREIERARTVDEALLSARLFARLESAINDSAFDELHTILFPIGSHVQQEISEPLSPTLATDPRFWWVFKNVEFIRWGLATSSSLLWVSGPVDRNIQLVASYILDQEQTRCPSAPCLLLYLFLPVRSTRRTLNPVLVILHQLLGSLSPADATSGLKHFLHSLLNMVFAQDSSDWNQLHFTERDSNERAIQKLLRAPANNHWDSFRAALSETHFQEISIIIDGMDAMGGYVEFVREIRTLLDRLLEMPIKLRAFLTSNPLTTIENVLEGIPCIQYDKERQECLASLHFENSRYSKISENHGNSFEWIWSHREYQEWSESNASQLLYLQGKPGSGKSTLTKYFSENIASHDTYVESAIVAKFFYSYREGVSQRSHYNMLLSILSGILSQSEPFFYHCFQSEYRRQRVEEHSSPSDVIDWDYSSLQKVLLSLRDYSLTQRIYLIIDAVDESQETDRREILRLLFQLCLEMKYCVVKIFVASRPVPVLERHIGRFHNFIRLQEETRHDISQFAGSFLQLLETGDHHFLAQATQYIVENAQGVFLWVRFVGEELLAYDERGYSQGDILRFLRSLPTELEEFYERMLDNVGKNRADLRDTIKTFQFIFFTLRPLTTLELLHALAIPSSPLINLDDLTDEAFEQHIPEERRIISCGGNFLEIKKHGGDSIVQIMHHTVREFFLNPGGYVATSDFRIDEAEAHLAIAVTCLRYLTLCVANLNPTLQDMNSWKPIQFEYFVYYLEQKPLGRYALRYLSYHLTRCPEDVKLQELTNPLIEGITDHHLNGFLESWLWECLLIRLSPSRLSSSSDLDIAYDFTNQVLLAAVDHNLPVATEVSLIVGADANLRDKYGMTPFLTAAQSGREAVVRLLADRLNINPDSKDLFGQSALAWAAENGHDAVVRLLADRPDVNADSQDTRGWTPLALAAGKGHEAVVRLLVDRKDVNSDNRDNLGQTPLSWAAENGHEAIVRLLLERRDVHADSNDQYGRTPLSWAAANGHEAVVQMLVRRGDVYPGVRDNRQQTPLSRAKKGGHVRVIEILQPWNFENPRSGEKDDESADITADSSYGEDSDESSEFRYSPNIEEDSSE